MAPEPTPASRPSRSTCRSSTRTRTARIGEAATWLADFAGERPVALIFGLYDRLPRRQRAGGAARALPGRGRVLHRLAIREAHPEDGWVLADNRREGEISHDPTSLEERAAAAEACALRLRPGIPILLDEVDDAVASAYGGWPDRLYLIGRDGSAPSRARSARSASSRPSWRTRSRPRSRSGDSPGDSPRTFAQRQRYENVKVPPSANALRMRRLTTIRCTSSGPS